MIGQDEENGNDMIGQDRVRRMEMIAQDEENGNDMIGQDRIG